MWNLIHAILKLGAIYFGTPCISDKKRVITMNHSFLSWITTI